MSEKIIDTINDILKRVCSDGRWYHISFSVKIEKDKECLDSISVIAHKEED